MARLLPSAVGQSSGNIRNTRRLETRKKEEEEEEEKEEQEEERVGKQKRIKIGNAERNNDSNARRLEGECDSAVPYPRTRREIRTERRPSNPHQQIHDPRLKNHSPTFVLTLLTYSYLSWPIPHYRGSHRVALPLSISTLKLLPLCIPFDARPSIQESLFVRTGYMFDSRVHSIIYLFPFRLRLYPSF